MSRIAHLLLTIASISCCSISIALRCAFAIVCTFVACCTFNNTFVDSYFSFTTMLSSLASFCTIYASTKCSSNALFSSDALMHTKFIDVAPSIIYFFARQCCLFLCKNSTSYVPVVSIS
jgi:hypothetical protein